MNASVTVLRPNIPLPLNAQLSQHGVITEMMETIVSHRQRLSTHGRRPYIAIWRMKERVVAALFASVAAWIFLWIFVVISVGLSRLPFPAMAEAGEMCLDVMIGPALLAPILFSLLFQVVPFLEALGKTKLCSVDIAPWIPPRVMTLIELAGKIPDIQLTLERHEMRGWSGWFAMDFALWAERWGEKELIYFWTADTVHLPVSL